MPLPAKIASLFRSLFHKARLDQELDAELRSYLDMLTEKKSKPACPLTRPAAKHGLNSAAWSR